MEIEKRLDNVESERLAVSIGGMYNDNILEVFLPLQSPVREKVIQSEDVLMFLNKGIEIRDLVEWIGWNDKTIFPDDAKRFRFGEPLGQCLVTARFAKDYFPGSKLVEVQVKQDNGLLKGPHMVLEVDIQGKNCYIDLTPDQEDALGRKSFPERERSMYSKVRIVEVGSDQSEYIFVRYQSDSDLETKKSRPIDHTMLLKELVLYYYQLDSPGMHNIERYGEAIDVNTEIAKIKNGLLREKIKSAKSKIANFSKIKLQVGVIDSHEFKPSPSWLWEATGLTPHSEVHVMHKGFPQESLFFDGNQIVIVNLSGWASSKVLQDIGAELGSDVNKLRPVFSPNHLMQQTLDRGITGPILTTQ